MIHKHHILISLLILPFVSVVKCQSNYRTEYSYTNSRGEYMYYSYTDSSIAANRVLTAKECYMYFTKNGKKQSKPSCSFRKYDSLGHVVQSYALKKNGEMRYLNETEYNDQGKVVLRKYGVKPSKTNITRYVYNDSGRLLEYTYSKGSKVLSKKKYVYLNGTQLQTVYSFKKDTTAYNEIRKSYYESDTGRLLRTESYTKKGKLKYVWDYTCNIQGEMNKGEKKTQTRICKSDITLPNGHRQKIYEEATYEGLRRYIYEMDSQNRTILYLSYGGKAGDKLWQKTEYTYEGWGQRTFTQVFDSDKGHLLRTYDYTYDDKGRTLKSISKYYKRKQKLRWSWQTEYTYDARLLIKSTSMNLEQPQNVSITTFDYIFRP